MSQEQKEQGKEVVQTDGQARGNFNTIKPAEGYAYGFF